MKTSRVFFGAPLVIGALFIIFFEVRAHNQAMSPRLLHELAGTELILDAQVKTAGCVAHDGYPDHDCTPGAIMPDATREQICTSGYSASVRSVSEKTKKEVYISYGIYSHKRGEYEVDHFISLELGGSNDQANLFPEAAEPRPGYHEKDEVENYLHEQLCDGMISVPEAQKLVSTRWVEVYQLLH